MASTAERFEIPLTPFCGKERGLGHRGGHADGKPAGAFCPAGSRAEIVQRLLALGLPCWYEARLKPGHDLFVMPIVRRPCLPYVCTSENKLRARRATANYNENHVAAAKFQGDAEVFAKTQK